MTNETIPLIDIKPGQELVQHPTPSSAAATWLQAVAKAPPNAGLVDEHTAETRQMKGLAPLPK